MKRNLFRISMVLGASGIFAAGLTAATLSGGAAKAAVAHTPAWHPVLSIPNGAKSNMVDTVVSTGKTSGWAFLHDATVAYERTGATAWKKVAFPGRGGAVNVAAASSPSNVWAAYRSSQGHGTQLYRWNGRWTVMKTFPGAGTITAISVLNPNDVWVFGGVGSGGQAGVFHYNGHKWMEVSSTLQGGYAVSDGNVWAFSGAQVAHFNGHKWTTTNVAKLLPPATRHVPATLTGIIALAPNNVYATGEGFTTPRGGPGVVLHFNGHTWSRVAEGSGFESVLGKSLASDGKGGLWIAGLSFPSIFPGLFHYSAGKITAVTVPGGAELTSVSRIPGTAAALAGGVQLVVPNGTSVVLQYS
ncbi:MAG TPA: hypothetical protein VN714_18165 [Trebonia sp.]|jgi:hypothetical protein|nr:hypothetical protein [Trebonia sp.]